MFKKYHDKSLFFKKFKKKRRNHSFLKNKTSFTQNLSPKKQNDQTHFKTKGIKVQVVTFGDFKIV